MHMRMLPPQQALLWLHVFDPGIQHLVLYRKIVTVPVVF
jgi:hypothetical protein